jgi:hypothetical protein
MSHMANQTTPTKRATKRAAPPAPAKKTTRAAATKTAPAKTTSTTRARKAALAVPHQAAPPAELPAAGWYLLPEDPTRKRWWTGSDWSGPTVTADAPTTQPAGVPTAPAPDPQDDDEPEVRETTTLTFAGRQVQVTRPIDGQLLVWSSIGPRVEKIEAQRQAAIASATNDTQRAQVQAKFAEQMSAVMSKGYSILQGLLATDDDRDWLEDQLLLGKMGLKEAMGLVSVTIDAWSGNTNTTAKPAAPAPRVRRRRA